MTLDAPNDYHLHMIPRRGKRGERRNVEDSSDLHGCCLLWRYSNRRDVSSTRSKEEASAMKETTLLPSMTGGSGARGGFNRRMEFLAA
jgi:hypothetical protein